MKRCVNYLLAVAGYNWMRYFFILTSVLLLFPRQVNPNVVIK